MTARVWPLAGAPLYDAAVAAHYVRTGGTLDPAPLERDLPGVVVLGLPGVQLREVPAPDGATLPVAVGRVPMPVAYPPRPWEPALVMPDGVAHRRMDSSQPAPCGLVSGDADAGQVMRAGDHRDRGGRWCAPCFPAPEPARWEVQPC